METEYDFVIAICLILCFFSFLGGVFWALYLVIFLSFFLVYLVFLQFFYQSLKKWVDYWYTELMIFLFIPIDTALSFTLSLVMYEGTDSKQMLLGIYDMYITITTLVLSLSFLLISLPSLYDRKRKTNSRHSNFYKSSSSEQSLRGFPDCGLNLISNSRYFLLITISALMLSLYFNILTSFSANIHEFSIVFSFLITSYFVILSIFGTFYFGVLFSRNFYHNSKK